MMSRPRVATILAFFLAAAILFGRLGALPLIDPDEGRNAEVAREMSESGSWLVPTLDGLAYLDKPAFYFDAVALSLRAFGRSEAAARLPSALFGMATLVLVFLFCRLQHGEPTAAAAVAVVASMPLFIAFSRLVIFDIALAFFVCAAVMAGYLAEEREGRARRLGHLLGAVAAGLATLVKGPVGFLVPWLVLSVFFLVERRRGAIGRMFALPNLIAFLAVVLPWFLLLARARPDFPRYGLLEESLRRFTTSEFRRTEPFYYYGPVIVGSCLAWSFLFPESIAEVWRARARWREWHRADRLFVVWTLVVVAFFSISQSKLAGYVLTAVIALGALVARLFALAWSDPRGRAAAIVRRGGAALAAASLLGAGLIALQIFDPSTFVRLFGVSAGEIEWFAPSLVPALLALLLIAALGLVAVRTRRVPIALGAFLGFPVLFLPAVFPGLRNYAEAGSSRVLAERIRSLAPEAEVVCVRCFPSGLPFYLGRTIPVISENGGELRSNYVLYTLRKPGKPGAWPASIVPLAEGPAWVASRPGPVLLVAHDSRRSVLEPLAAGLGAKTREIAPGWWAALLDPQGPR